MWTFRWKKMHSCEHTDWCSRCLQSYFPARFQFPCQWEAILEYSKIETKRAGGKRLSSQECVLLFQRTRVQSPAPTSGGFHLPASSALEDPVPPFGLHRQKEAGSFPVCSGYWHVPTPQHLLCPCKWIVVYPKRGGPGTSYPRLHSPCIGIRGLHYHAQWMRTEDGFFAR